MAEQAPNRWDDAGADRAGPQLGTDGRSPPRDVAAPELGLRQQVYAALRALTLEQPLTREELAAVA
ncbi:MAG: hypothetical protein JJT89_00025 [Nitriliruptoraceae bacterium]|nr:hypothetical protein [Nitriliruptoraceae bacterium]